MTERPRPATVDDWPHMASELTSLGYRDLKCRWDAQERIVAVGVGPEGVRAPGGGFAPADQWIQAVVCQMLDPGTVH